MPADSGFRDAEFSGDALVEWLLLGEKTELLLGGFDGWVRILHDAGKSGVSEHETALAPSLELVGEQTESIGIAIEVGDVSPLLRSELPFVFDAFTFAEVGGDGTLARMAERWVAHVVCQTGGRDNGTYLGEEGAVQFGMLLSELVCHIIAQTAADAGHFERVGEAVMYENAAWQRENLRLVLHTAERSREDETVVVALELRAVVVAVDVQVFLPESLVGYKL